MNKEKKKEKATMETKILKRLQRQKNKKPLINPKHKLDSIQVFSQKPF